MKMRSPFKRSGRGQGQGSRLKTIPGCKTECAFLLLLLLGLTSVINNGRIQTHQPRFALWSDERDAKTFRYISIHFKTLEKPMVGISL